MGGLRSPSSRQEKQREPVIRNLLQVDHHHWIVRGTHTDKYFFVSGFEKYRWEGVSPQLCANMVRLYVDDHDCRIINSNMYRNMGEIPI